jgi:hypothetical protein
MQISLDRQDITQHCPDCSIDFKSIRGSVYDDGARLGLYLIALHGHTTQGRIAHLALAITEQTNGQAKSVAAAIDVLCLPDEIGFSVAEWAYSPWRNEKYLGEMLSRDNVLSNPHKSLFFHIAEHIYRDLPEVMAYFAD